MGRTRTSHDKCAAGLLSLGESSPLDLAHLVLVVCSDQSRIGCGKDRRAVDEMSRDSERAREPGSAGMGVGVLGGDLHTSTSPRARPKPRQEEQVPMECGGLNINAVVCRWNKDLYWY